MSCKVCIGQDAMVCVGPEFVVTFRKAKVASLNSGVGDTSVPDDTDLEQHGELQHHLPTHAGYDAFVVPPGADLAAIAEARDLCPKSVTCAPRVRSVHEALARVVIDMNRRYNSTTPVVFDSYMLRKTPASGPIIPREDSNIVWSDWKINMWDPEFRKHVWYELSSLSRTSKGRDQLNIAAAMTAFSVMSYEKHVASKSDSILR